jgi:hypothetical protein
MGVTCKSVKLHIENPREFYSGKSGEIEVGENPQVCTASFSFPSSEVISE